MNLVRSISACGLVLLVASAAAPAGAQTIYQCGNEYTRIPCADGRALDTADTRSGAQRAEARRLLEDQRRQGEEMARERRRNEAALKPAVAGSLSAPRPADAASAPGKPAAKKKRHKLKAKEDDFVATAPPSSRKQNTSR